MLATVALVAGGLLAVATPPAQAAVPTGPTAIEVAPNGITYVGFAAGGSLQRVDATGASISALPLPRNGAVDGLSVDGDGNIWVSYGTGASKLSPSGSELFYFDYPGTPSCPAAEGNTDPSRFGGIEATPVYIYVATRCQNAVLRFALDGTQRGAIFTADRVRGIAYVPPQPNVNAPDKIFFSIPSQGKVYEYPPVGPSNGGQPLFVLNVPQSGPNTPVPAGIAVDKFGQLAVSDVANDKILLFDTNNRNGANSYSWYRTLGRPGSNAGDLNNASALSQYPVDGPLTARRGDFFIADTGNNRIQRWNTSGYTYWTASTSGGSVPQTAPVNTERPAISGNPAVGQTLSCSTGAWSGSPTSFEYGWNRNGGFISGESANTYQVRSGDSGQQISCFVRATNNVGQSDFATSEPVTISNTPSAPVNQTRPTITGTAAQGQTLTCTDGTWSGSPTYTRVWNRNGNPIGGATGQTYTVQSADVGQALTCTVTATNGTGSASATSDAVTPIGPATCTGNTTPGVSINNAATFTNSEAVTLRIVPPSGATAVFISNDGGFGGSSSQSLSGDCSYPWTLSLSGSDRTAKNVYVRFAGSNQRFSDDIVLDRTAPAVSTAKVKKSTKRKVTIKLRATDRNSGIKRVEFAKNRKGAQAKKVRYKKTYKVRKAAKKRYRFVRIHDRAGNVSDWKRVKPKKKKR